MNTELKKIYTLTKPPSPDYPYLHPVRHAEIIRNFNSAANACHTLNYWGEVDFYLLTTNDDYINGVQNGIEEFALKIPGKNSKNIEIYYCEDNIESTFRFNTKEPMDYHILKNLIEKKEVDIYFVRLLAEEYVCIGFKTVYLPSMLCYDIQRFLEDRKPLLLPTYYNNIVIDRQIREAAMIKKAWGFYLDFTTMTERIGSIQEAEEIISRHVLDGVARLQRSRQKNTGNECLCIWTGKKIMLNQENVPREYYNIYINSDFLFDGKEEDLVKKVIEKSLKELPEFERCLWTSPLAEESLPIACLYGNRLYRINITRGFYKRLARMFQKFYLPVEGYVSHYQKILSSKEAIMSETKVYNIFEKRRNKKRLEGTEGKSPTPN